MFGNSDHMKIDPPLLYTKKSSQHDHKVALNFVQSDRKT